MGCFESYVERQNLNLRMGVRRFTRLTNAFSKKFENHCHMVAIYHAYYNFCRVHQTLRVTPAMEAGLADHIWSLEELVGLLEQRGQGAAAEARGRPYFWNSNAQRCSHSYRSARYHNPLGETRTFSTCGG